MFKAVLAAAALLALAPAAGRAQQIGGDPAKGREVFQDRCTSCHILGANGMGPNLVGVVGRKAASAPGFHYSAALSQAGLTWGGPELDRFLSGPAKMVPGTPMRATVADPADRHDLIAYLASLKAGAR